MVEVSLSSKKDKPSAITKEIDACLPQTQCTLCGYPRCTDYADAIRQGTADINLCTPGGAITIQALASLLNLEAIPPLEKFTGRKLAKIREIDCIGCTLCLKPCPVDAIVGTAKYMHSVLASECTGCGLCVPLCPVDCIEMHSFQPVEKGKIWEPFQGQEVQRWRKLAELHFTRLESIDCENSLDATESDRKLQIRESVNRVRRKRWKQSRRPVKHNKTRQG